MRNIVPKILLVLAAALVAGGARADTTPGRTEVAYRAMTSGTEQLVSFLYALNPDCSSRGDVEVRLVTPPAHGTLRLEKLSDFPDYGKDNDRSACNERLITG